VAFRSIGVVAGVADELTAFLPGFDRQRAGAARHVSWEGRDIFLLCTGIGKVAAATAAAMLRAEHKVELLAVIGTAGKIGKAEGHLFNIAEAIQADYGAQRAEEGLVHYTAGSWPIGPAHLEPFKAMALPSLDLPRARIATSDLFVECPDHSLAVHDRLGATLIDMETGAVAQAADLLGIPWIAIKATTDSADGDSADHFTTNLGAAARASAEAMEAAIASL
jgi:adenosylhomocysteine nucleosidase